MSDNNMLPSYLDQATKEEKETFFQALICLAGADGDFNNSELKFIKDSMKTNDLDNFEELKNYKDEAEVLKKLSLIKNRHLALELIREMCVLSHADNVLSDNETLFIGKAGIMMGLELEKIEQISNWVIDRIIWVEQAKIIFEENN